MASLVIEVFVPYVLDLRRDLLLYLGLCHAEGFVDAFMDSLFKRSLHYRSVRLLFVIQMVFALTHATACEQHAVHDSCIQLEFFDLNLSESVFEYLP